MSWTDEERDEVIKRYKESEPTAENSNDTIKEIAVDLGKTVNGVRSILVRKEIYVKKELTAKKTEGTTSTKVNKADALASLKEIMEDNSLTVDAAIIDKLTGKAAIYFTTAIKSLTEKED